MRLINEFVQVQSELFESHWNNDFDIDPVVISGFFLDGGRYCEGSIHMFIVICETDAADFAV